MKSFLGGLAFVSSVMLSAMATAADKPVCNLQRVAEIPAKMENGHLLIQLKIGDRDIWMKIGTNEPVSEINWALAKDLGLRPRDAAHPIIDDAGHNLTHYVVVPTVSIGGMTASNTLMIIQSEKTTAPAHQDGTLGSDFLMSYDVEFDVPHGKVNLFTHEQCSAPVAYWTSDFAAIPFKPDHSKHPIFKVQLDGHEVTGTIDTAIDQTRLRSQFAASEFKIEPAAGGTTPDGSEETSSGALIPYFNRRFDDLKLGDIDFHKTEIGIGYENIARIMQRDGQLGVGFISDRNIITPLSIGMHHLARLRFYIAYDKQVILLSAGDAN